MNFVVSHIYREGNQCADRLANFGLSIHSISFWPGVPVVISGCFVNNKLGLPNFRFVSLRGSWHSPPFFVVRILLFMQMNLLISKVNDQNALTHVNSR